MSMSSSVKSNNVFDKECSDRYGQHTCILVETTNNIFEVRLLDEPQNTLQQHGYYIARTNLYEVIPKMLMKNYTVVIAELCQGLKEISAVHHPVQSSLNTPPILQ